MFVGDWFALLRIIVLAPLAYAALVCLLRVSGKRTLAKLNAFDLIVTVALGSTLSTVITSKSLPLDEGLVALLSLVLLQYAVAWVSVRSGKFSELVKSEPTLLLHDGRLLPNALVAQRVTTGEVRAALRGSGLEDFSEAAAVVLETDGSLSVIPASARHPNPSPVSVP
ncbi:MAG: DUF421 domain-containing protein [Acetobacteraceae bacterium]|nr:DUF421 domain-containing protein [Acetobacteraceae bacterium]